MTATSATVTSIQSESADGKKKENARAIQPTNPLAAAAVKAKAKQREAPKPKPKPEPATARPAKFLPSERITFSRQLDILRGWAAASGPLRKAVTNNDVGKIVDMQSSTVSLANAFFSSVGLLTKTEGGYIPAEEVTAFLRAWDWSKDTAAQKLTPVIARSWFAEALASKLEFGPRTENDCIQDLADAARAAPEYRANLRILLEYLAAAGLIQRDGGMVKKGSANMTTGTATPPASAINAESNPAPKSESQSTDPSKMMPSLFGTTEGQVQFNIAVKVSMGEFSTWQADRIAAFFNGIAQVLAAKAKVEQGE